MIIFYICTWLSKQRTRRTFDQTRTRSETFIHGHWAEIEAISAHASNFDTGR